MLFNESSDKSYFVTKYHCMCLIKMKNFLYYLNNFLFTQSYGVIRSPNKFEKNDSVVVCRE